jgi:tetratricopeptide (TPR) repeat protein
MALILPVLVAATSAFGAEDKGPPALNEKTSALFEKIAPAQKEAKWKEIVEMIDAALPTIAPDSVDLTELLYSKGIALLQVEDYSHALEPLENALRISEAHKGSEVDFLGKGRTLMLLDILAKLNAQEAQNAKTAAAQEPYYAKSVAYFKRLLKEAQKVPLDTRLTYAQVLLAYALLDQEKPNTALIKEVRSEVENILASTVKPTERMYSLLQVAVQQSGDFEKLAQVLELMVNQYPNNQSYWTNLMGAYNQLAQDNAEKNPEKFRQFYTRAINTIERAQAYGFLKDARNQSNLVMMYSLVGQFGRSTELMHAGLRNGTIESDPKTWSQLAYAYQQAHQNLEAINALKEASKLFPKAAMLDWYVGNIYYDPATLDDPKNAVVFYKSAIQKQDELQKSTNLTPIEKQGELDKKNIVPTLSMIAYISLELNQFEEALKYVERAEKAAEGPKDPRLEKMKEAIVHSLEEARNNAAPKPAPAP